MAVEDTDTLWFGHYRYCQSITITSSLYHHNVSSHEHGHNISRTFCAILKVNKYVISILVKFGYNLS